MNELFAFDKQKKNKIVSIYGLRGALGAERASCRRMEGRTDGQSYL